MCYSYVVVWLGWCGIRMQAEALVCVGVTLWYGCGGVVLINKPANANLCSLPINVIHEITQQISRKLLRMDVLTSETC